MWYNIKLFFRQLIFANVFWIIACVFFILIRFSAYGQEQQANIVDAEYKVPVTEWIFYGVITGILIGMFYAVIEFLFEKFITKNIYLGISVIIKTCLYIVVLVFSLTFILRLIELNMNIDLPNQRGWWKTSPIFWLAAAYFFVASFIFLFIKIANEKFGNGILINMLIGKYRKPTEEERIFMFLDLKSSTSIAEDLGHYKYSQLLQDCFFDLNKVINQFNGEIYQYVGDEAVITWPTRKALKRNNCVALYFAFMKILQKRSKYYNRTYGLMPFFKAGLHGGKLIITEVGIVKKELAFHGDVINTASRIQDLCNKYDASLLISESLLSKMKLKKKFKSELKETIKLKGKEDSVNIYEIKKNYL